MSSNLRVLDHFYFSWCAVFLKSKILLYSFHVLFFRLTFFITQMRTPHLSSISLQLFQYSSLILFTAHTVANSLFGEVIRGLCEQECRSDTDALRDRRHR